MSPVFEFRMKDAPSAAFAKSFVQSMIETKRVFRNERGLIVWAIRPGDYCPIARKEELQSVLESGELLTITGPTDSPACWFTLWCAITNRRWMLPRVGGAWVGPDQPKPEYGALPARLVRR